MRFFTTLREVTGKREENIEFTKGSTVTVDDVLQKLTKRHGKEFAEYLIDRRTRQPKGFLQFLINGKSISPTEGIKARIRDGDVLAIIPPVGGG